MKTKLLKVVIQRIAKCTVSFSNYLAQWEVFEEIRSSVCLPEGEGRGVAGNFEASTTVLGCNLGLEGPPVLRVGVQSLEK